MVKLVIFDLGGVLFKSPFSIFAEFEKKVGVPNGFIGSVMRHGAPDNAFCKLERGELVTSQFYPLFEKECHDYAASNGIEAPSDLSISELFHLIHTTSKDGESRAIKPIINASRAIRNNGIKTCVLSNIWYHDDVNESKMIGSLYSWLRQNFDEVILSCEVNLRKPDPEIYKLVCKRMGVEPSEAVFLDDLGGNLKPAKELGIETILVKEDATDAVNKLQDVVGFNITEKQKPTPCDPEKVSHSYVSLRTGIKMHYVEMGEGPCLILLHGFPESWYFWRYQIPALAAAGFRVIVPDQRGFGETSSPDEIEAYTWENICGDIIALMDALCIPQSTVIGHDWGGVIVWALGLHYPERIKAIASMTPLLYCKKDVNPLEVLQADPDGVFSYQLYFMEEGRAEKEFGGNPKRTFAAFLRSPQEMAKMAAAAGVVTTNVIKRGGLLVGLPDNFPRDETLISEEEHDYITEQFTKSGFRGGLNWYRNVERNWRWCHKIFGRTIHQPCLKITVGHDKVISPGLWKGMHNGFESPKMTEVHIEESGHWTMLQCPDELNKILTSWLRQVFPLPSKI